MTGPKLPLIGALLALSAAIGVAGASGRRDMVRVTVLHREPIVAHERRPWRVVPWTLESRLTVNDFEVSRDQVPCVVDSASPADTRLAVALLLDVSSSSQVRFDHILKAVRKFVVPTLRPSDRLSVVRIGGKEGVVATPFTSAASEVVKAAETVLAPSAGHPMTVNLGFGYGPSPIWDAVDGAVTALRAERDTRGVILLTDGRATGNRVGIDEVVGRAVEAGVPVSVVGAVVARVLRQDAVTAARVRPKVFIEGMADETGGVYIDLFGIEPFFPAPTGTALTTPQLQWPQDEPTIVHWVGRSLVHAIEALRASYVVDVSCPTTTAGPHLLDVRVKRPGFDVRAPRAIVN
jgi:hypothetical protein